MITQAQQKIMEQAEMCGATIATLSSMREDFETQNKQALLEGAENEF
jgi:hypothetical protein